jgi:hypothetical protein
MRTAGKEDEGRERIINTTETDNALSEGAVKERQ